jgi:hypothetical protein
MSAMRTLIAILCLTAASAFAMGPEYFSSRQWIEDHTPKDKTPKEQRIFVGDSKQTTRTFIMRYHQGVSLRDIIDATHFRTNDVMVTVLRSERKIDPVFDDIVRASAKPSFTVRAQDVIWISTLPVVRN